LERELPGLPEMRITLLLGLLLCATACVFGLPENPQVAELGVDSSAPCDKNETEAVPNNEHLAAQMEKARELLQGEESQATMYGKAVCDASFAETKMQCDAIKLAVVYKPEDEIRDMLKAAGTAIIEASNAAGNSEASPKLSLKDRKMFMEASLGESSGMGGRKLLQDDSTPAPVTADSSSYSSSSDAAPFDDSATPAAASYSSASYSSSYSSDQVVESAGTPYKVNPSSAKAMTSLACGQFYAAVERLCSRSLTTKNYGVKAMEDMVATHNVALNNTAVEAAELGLRSNHMQLEHVTKSTGPIEEEFEEVVLV